MVGLIVTSVPLVFAQANAPWGTSDISVGVLVQSGEAISAWDDAARNDMTGAATSFFVPGKSLMTAIGDGTYEMRVDLIPGAVYNYIFSARLNASMAGFTTGYAAVEPVPNSGGDSGTFISLSSTTVSAPGSGSIGYTSIGGDGRRHLIMPDVAAGTTLYLFHNFASTPTGVAGYSVSPGEDFLELRWAGGLGYWGSGSPALDTIGGGYFLYISTADSAGTFSPLATLTGEATYYKHTGLTPGTSYFFIFVSSDAYAGVTNPAASALWANLTRPLPPDTTWDSDEYVHNDKSGKPGYPVPVYFKVENIDEKHSVTGSIVYLTPEGVNGRIWPYKIPGLLVVGYVPRS